MTGMELFLSIAVLSSYFTLLLTLRANHRELDQQQAELDRMQAQLDRERQR